MKLTSITQIPVKDSRCIEVDSDDRLFAAGGKDGDSIVSHNSVVQRNIILGCILRPDSWRFLGIDLKKVELSAFRAYSNVVLGIATELEDALTVLRFGQETMMKRYAEMEQLGVNNFLDLPEKGAALMIMVDEAGELLSPSGVKALSENTLIPTPSGLRFLRNITEGDIIFDNFCKETVVTKKYVPDDQDCFSMRIMNDKTGNSEDFIAGREHNWCVYFLHPDNTVTGPEVVDTEYLYSFVKNQNILPEEERVKIKFKRVGDFEKISENFGNVVEIL